MTAIRKPPAPSLEDLVREFMANTSWPPSVAEMLAFVRSIPPINAEAERAEALRAERDRLMAECVAWRENDEAAQRLKDYCSSIPDGCLPDLAYADLLGRKEESTTDRARALRCKNEIAGGGRDER